MNSSIVKRSFPLSRLEIFLGAAVLLGLGYMVYLFGFAAPTTVAHESQYLTETAQKSLTTLAQRQHEVANVADKIVSGLNQLPKPLKGTRIKADQVKTAELKRLNDLLTKFVTTQGLIEAQLAEMTRLLPSPKEIATQE